MKTNTKTSQQSPSNSKLKRQTEPFKERFYWKHIARLLLFFTLVIFAFIAYRKTGLDFISLKLKIKAMGPLGVGTFLAIYIVFITLGLPNLPFQLAAGAIYGIIPAFVMMYLAVNLGALSAFSLARHLGRKGIEQLWGHRIKNLNLRIQTGGFRLILYLRLIPLMPFNAINYASGLSRIRLFDYLSANAVGMLPLTFLHVYFGHAASNHNLRELKSWGHPEILIPILISISLVAVMFLIGKKYRRSAPN